ncbi:MAG: MFS transporter [Bdellovibrionales bacterium]|nr:MFS transporter [Bdellovibrionales bacterium]
MKSITQAKFSTYEKRAISILVLLQFTLVLDFMVMAPLGAVLMPTFGIAPQQFSLLVASYALSACFSGFFSSGFADSFERKKYLTWIYLGFLAGTFSCAVANSYETLLAARMITGLFGGIIASLIQTLITDIFPEGKRGQVIGFTQISFGFCQAFALPIALYFSNRWSWHAPFLMVVALGILLLGYILVELRPIRDHLALQKHEGHWTTLGRLLRTESNRWGFLGTLIMTLGGYLLMPFTSAYNVNNLGMDIQMLPYFYLCCGVSVILMAPSLGKIADRVGNFRVYVFGVFIAAGMALFYTQLTQANFALMTATNILVFLGFFSIIIPFQSMVTRLPSPGQRAGFMSITASLQQLGGGISVLIAGSIITKDAAGKLQNFPRIGYALAAILAASFFVTRKINSRLR